MSLKDFLGRGRDAAVSPGRQLKSRLSVEYADGRLIVVDAGRLLLASWSGGTVVAVWALDADGTMREQVAILHRPIPDATSLRAMTEWLRGVLASYAPSSRP